MSKKLQKVNTDLLDKYFSLDNVEVERIKLMGLLGKPVVIESFDDKFILRVEDVQSNIDDIPITEDVETSDIQDNKFKE